jgi:hypothetical protein
MNSDVAALRSLPLLRTLVLLAVLLLAGCAGRNEVPLQRQMSPLPPQPICRLAVLPFANDSNYLLADAIVSKVFAARLQDAGNYLLAQDGDIQRAYRQLGIMPGTSPNLDQLQIIGGRLNTRLLITGSVLEMREDRGDHGSVNPFMIFEVAIRDGSSGDVLWTTFHRRQGSEYKKTLHFGSIHTVTGLSQQMADEIISLWFRKGLVPCNL